MTAYQCASSQRLDQKGLMSLPNKHVIYVAVLQSDRAVRTAADYADHVIIHFQHSTLQLSQIQITIQKFDT